MSPLHIRQLQDQDTDLLIRLFGSPTRSAEQFHRDARDHWSGKRTVLVAVESGAPVGCITLTWHSSYPAFEFAAIPEIGDLGVIEDAGSEETGRALIREAERLAQERGHARLGAASSVDQSAAARLYAEMGYLPDGRGRHLTRAGPMEYLIKLLPAPQVMRPVEEEPWSSTWGRRLAAAYILLVAMAAGYVSYRVVFAGPRSPFAGIIMVLLSYPWGRVLAEFLRVHGGAGVVAVLLLSYALNAGMAYILGSSVERMLHGKKSLKAPAFRAETDS